MVWRWAFGVIAELSLAGGFVMALTPICVLLAGYQTLVRASFAMFVASAGDMEVVAEAGTGRQAMDLARSAGALPFRDGHPHARVDAFRSRRLRDRTLRDCAPLGAVIDQARLNPTPYVAATLAGLLSWDIERLPAAERPLVVAFADAVEYVQSEEQAQERLLNRIVHLSPGILWVATSRCTLTWASAANGLLPACGPQVGTGLRLDAPDAQQHLIGNLSDTDVDRYLRAASGTAGNPVLSPQVIDRIRRGAHGLPLYLDLSLSIARQAGAASLDEATFGRPLPELVTRLFADLPDQERDVARAAALVPRFDPGLVARASGVLDGSARRFCARSLVTRDTHPVFPFRLHDAVRLRAVARGHPGPGGRGVTRDGTRTPRQAGPHHAGHPASMREAVGHPAFTEGENRP
jgi:hypothetical protein